MATTTAGHNKVNWGLFGLIVGAVIAALVLWTVVVQPILSRDLGQPSAEAAIQKYIDNRAARVASMVGSNEQPKITSQSIDSITYEEAREKFNFSTARIPDLRSEEGTTYYYLLATWTLSLEGDMTDDGMMLYTVYKGPNDKEWSVVPVVD